MIPVHILATGSSGNCVLLDNQILIDAGITYKHFCEFGVSADQVKLCVITHKHGDHMNKPFVRKLLTLGVPVWMPKNAVADLQLEGKMDMEEQVRLGNVTFLEAGGPFSLPGNLSLTVHPQSHHDIVNYALVFERDRERLLYSTDLDSLEPTDNGEGLLHLGMFDTILLEGNYDEPYLRSYIEYMISLVPQAENPREMDNKELEAWVKQNYRFLPDEVARNAFRAIQNHRHLSKQQARAYASAHLKPGGTYYEIHRSRTFYEEPAGWREGAAES